MMLRPPRSASRALCAVLLAAWLPPLRAQTESYYVDIAPCMAESEAVRRDACYAELEALVREAQAQRVSTPPVPPAPPAPPVPPEPAVPGAYPAVRLGDKQSAALPLGGMGLWVEAPGGQRVFVILEDLAQ